MILIVIFLKMESGFWKELNSGNIYECIQLNILDLLLPKDTSVNLLIIEYCRGIPWLRVLL